MTLTKQRKGGVIDPSKLYTTDACMNECKIGRNTLRDMREANLIKPIEIANQFFYDGAELIAAVKELGKRK